MRFSLNRKVLSSGKAANALPLIASTFELSKSKYDRDEEERNQASNSVIWFPLRCKVSSFSILDINPVSTWLIRLFDRYSRRRFLRDWNTNGVRFFNALFASTRSVRFSNPVNESSRRFSRKFDEISSILKLRWPRNKLGGILLIQLWSKRRIWSRVRLKNVCGCNSSTWFEFRSSSAKSEFELKLVSCDNKQYGQCN